MMANFILEGTFDANWNDFRLLLFGQVYHRNGYQVKLIQAANVQEADRDPFAWKFYAATSFFFSGQRCMLSRNIHGIRP